MTLTLKTAKHAIDKHGEVFKIVENFADPTELSNGAVTRDEIEDIGEYDPDFKPCVVVTTAREALDAAWELAYEPEDGVIPANAWHIRRSRSNGDFLLAHSGPAVHAGGIHAERRLLDPPEPEPEPWEVSRYCFADGLFHERREDEHGTFWLTVEDIPGSYEREDLAKLDPRPVTIE